MSKATWFPKKRCRFSNWKIPQARDESRYGPPEQSQRSSITFSHNVGRKKKTLLPRSLSEPKCKWERNWIAFGIGCERMPCSGWIGLCVSLHNTWPFIQIAEFTGVTGLSFVVAFANVIAVTTPVRLYLEARTRQVRPHFDLTLTL